MEIVFATNNLNKLKEVQNLVPQHIKLLSLKDIGCFEEIPETQDTIEGNAMQKANYIKNKYDYDCFADDTGLEVEALNNMPGVDSAHYAGAHRNAEDNMNKLLKELENASNRTAQFKTIIALHLNNQLKVFEGICKGEIIDTKRGKKGFGYDPIFKPLGFNQTFAEMDMALKNSISHRGKAIQKLISILNQITP